MHVPARFFAARMVLALAAILSSPMTAFAQPAIGGEVFVADVREAPSELGLSSSIALQPDGRFTWLLRVGELALSARGEWERDGGMIRLANPEQVGEPAIALAGSARDDSAALGVSLEPATARMASALEVELEYAGNRFARIPLAEGEIRLPSGEERPIAVRLASPSFAFRTQPIALAPDGDNVLTLRLVPADLGQAFFASQQQNFDAGGMTLDWRGIALRYDRVTERPGGH